MKDHCSSKVINGSSMAVERSKLKEEPYISSAHIRSLVKRLSSSRSSSIAPAIVGDHSHPQNSSNHPIESSSTTRQPKKQVRRRSNISRPYQERLMNMAEVRREIVTALKFHRAAMKRAAEQQQKEILYQQPSPTSQKPEAILEESHSSLLVDTLKPNPIAPCYTQQSSYSSPCSYSSSPWTHSHFTPLPSDKLFNLRLPNQPLGLNLNFQGFNNIEKTSLFRNSHNNNNESPIIQQTTSSSTSASSSSSSTPGMANLNSADSTLHRVMGDEELEEIRSIYEKHDMELNDIMNSVKTAWWSKFLKATESDDEGDIREGDAFRTFSDVIELPAWLTDGSGMDNYQLENQIHDQVQDFILPW